MAYLLVMREEQWGGVEAGAEMRSQRVEPVMDEASRRSHFRDSVWANESEETDRKQTNKQT